jgi:serine/threonine protein kinase
MTLQPGARLGLYEIVAPIGAGGMGEVYRARDLKLGREVAIKIVPASLAHDRDRATRFTREAQVLAALNHPHIGMIMGWRRPELSMVTTAPCSFCSSSSSTATRLRDKSRCPAARGRASRSIMR